MKWLFIAIIILITSCSTVFKEHDVSFLNDACILPFKGYKYLTGDDIKIKIDDEFITIEKGFETDLASIPKPFWIFVSPALSSIMMPAILHDYLYKHNLGRPRSEIDDIFYYALISNGFSKTYSSFFWFAVRLGGWASFKPQRVVEIHLPEKLETVSL